jgi:hypothetical protein
MRYFESLRTMLLGFANEPIEPDYSDPQYIPIRQHKRGEGFTLNYHGRSVAVYQVWIYPDSFHSNVGYMSLQIQKQDDEIICLTFRVCSTSAYKTYEYTFNFLDGKPAVEMRVGRGANVTGERVRWEKVRCIDFVVFDLINLMLPPQILAYKPEFPRIYLSTADHPCFVCGASVPYSWETCNNCVHNRVGAVV